jgi:outer membrane protein TolC
MKTISEKRFVEFMTDALPDLISSIMREDNSAVSQGQVSVPQFWALHYINEHGTLTVNELARVLNRSKSTTSALLQRLENNGLVKRERSTSDQRMVHSSLTPRGERIINQLVLNRREGIRNTYAPLTGPERMQYMALMKKILAGIHKTTGLILLLGGMISAEAMEAPRTYTLEESVRIGLRRSLPVANAARERQIAETTKKRATAKAWPQLTGSANYTRNYPEKIGGMENIAGRESRTLGAEASWQIFSGGRVISGIRAARAYRQLTAHQERRIRETRTHDIIVGYYNVQLAEAEVEVREQSVKQLADFESDSRKKYGSGTASEFDWLSAKVSLANEQPRLIAAQNRLSLLKERLRNLTYMDEGEFNLSDPLEHIPMHIELPEAIALGMRKRPDLLEKSFSLALREEDIKQKKSEFYPKVDLFAAYQYQNPDPFSFITQEEDWQDYWNTGIRTTWNIFDGGTRRAALGESKLRAAIAEDEYRDLQRTVSFDIRSQWLRSRDAVDAIHATTESIGLAERALGIARTRFEAGLGTHLEVTQANLELSDARLTRNQALYEYIVAVTGIKHAMGTLLEEYENE